MPYYFKIMTQTYFKHKSINMIGLTYLSSLFLTLSLFRFESHLITEKEGLTSLGSSDYWVNNSQPWQSYHLGGSPWGDQLNSSWLWYSYPLRKAEVDILNKQRLLDWQFINIVRSLSVRDSTPGSRTWAWQASKMILPEPHVDTVTPSYSCYNRGLLVRTLLLGSNYALL